MREKRWLLTVAVVLCYAIQLCALPSKDKTVTLNLNGVSIENFLDAVKKTNRSQHALQCRHV